jgi:hypothetical protein
MEKKFFYLSRTKEKKGEEEKKKNEPFSRLFLRLLHLTLLYIDANE